MMKKLFQTFSIKRFDFLLVILIVALNLIGIAAIGSAAPQLQSRQVAGMILGLIVMVFVSTIDYQAVLKLYWPLYIANLVLLRLVISIGVSGGGAQRWINIGGLTFQPSEAAKIILILFFSKFIMKYKNRIKSLSMVAICLILVAVPIYLVQQQPDLSTSIMLLVIFSVIMFAGGISFRLVAGVLVVIVPSAIVFLSLVIQEGSTILKPYQRDRIMAWLHPENYESTTAYQTLYSIMAIGSGKLQGKGYNANSFVSLLNSGYISASQTDFIFTVIGEEFGFIGSCGTVILLALIAVRCLLIARSAGDTAGKLIAAGMGAWIGFQGFINIGVVTGTIPNTGLPLPFVSYGLTSLISLYMGIGFVLNVHMQSRKTAIQKSFNIYGGSVNEYSAYRT